MKKFALVLTAALAGSLGSGHAAEAASITFDLFDPSLGFGNDIQNSFNFSEGGLDLEVTASNTVGVGANVVQTAAGLGVETDFNFFSDSSLQVDGFGGNETLNLSFSAPIVPQFATFTFVGGNDDVTIELDGSTLFSDTPIASTPPDFNFFGIAAIDITTAESGTLLSFSAIENNDSFFLKSVKVEDLSTGAVPEPLTIVGGAIALGFGGAMRRKFAR